MSGPGSPFPWADHPERHSVTVMFADIEGSTEMIGLADAETAAELLDPVIRVMVTAAERHNGVVGHRGDGIMATFGAPSICEDHALRACLAALTIREQLAPPAFAGVRVGIGVHSGEVGHQQPHRRRQRDPAGDRGDRPCGPAAGADRGGRHHLPEQLRPRPGAALCPHQPDPAGGGQGTAAGGPPGSSCTACCPRSTGGRRAGPPSCGR